eukprot:snap_masked-scaffold_6-processed-gene-10.34-mRNA-1 protein AED:0.29 eAED:1.00 QI:0/-1/0/1/-1/1/1/0/276
MPSHFSAFLSDDEDDKPRKQATKAPVKKAPRAVAKKTAPKPSPKQAEQNTSLNSKPKQQQRGKDGGKGGNMKEQRNRGHPKRQYDRRSGTGRGKEGKKQGGGRHNWGKQEEQEPIPEEEPKEETEENKEDGEEGEGEETKEEPEKKTLTLEEFTKQKEEEKKSYGAGFEELEEFQVDEVQGKEYVKVEKDEDFLSGSNIERKTKTKKGKAKAEKSAGIDPALLGFKAPRSDSRGNNYRDRERGRGGYRGRGGKSFPRPPKRDIKVDEKAFPALGTA